jgi:FkbM family methyltransferase
MIKTIKLADGSSAKIIEGDTHICKWIEDSGRLDHDQNMLPLLIPHLRGTVLDIGAFVGDHTTFYARHADRVLAFEPNPEAFECLAYNTGDLANVSFHEVGLGARSGTASLVPHANAGMATLRSGDEISIITLDSLSLPSVTFIKIDAEGWECDILEGARATIARCRPAMLIEVNAGALKLHGRSAGELLTMLGGMQYVMRNIYAEQPMSGTQFDMLCEPLFP